MPSLLVPQVSVAPSINTVERDLIIVKRVLVLGAWGVRVRRVCVVVSGDIVGAGILFVCILGGVLFSSYL